ncbi:MAG TPA: ABC transporter ATP-binding protein [Candidatus Dormibacteraeota bacterium]|jgi:ATP-binding cassette subfamily B protein|nr:ABC transporter ATP-binding protein [Candidatus Dormibacteraeota bacterium]
MVEQPPASRLRAAVSMVRLAWSGDPRRSLIAVGLTGLQALVASLFALWLKLMIDGVQAHRTLELVLAAVAIALSIGVGAGLDFATSRVRVALNERVHHLVELRLLEAVARTPTLAIHENPAHIGQLEMLEAESWEFGDAIPSLVTVLQSVIRVIITALLLASVTPLLLLLPLFGLPALLLSPITGDLFNRGNELSAEASRRAVDLFELATGEAAAKEVRLFRLARPILDRFHRAHAQVRETHVGVGIRGGAIGLAADLVFILGYLGAIVLAVARVRSGQAGVGDVALTAVLAGQVLSLITGFVGSLQWVQRTMRACARFVYLTDVAETDRAGVDAGLRVPERLRRGIRLEAVSYRYPTAEEDSLRSLDVFLPAGSTVAVVGENGAGKSTLVKLLAGLYRPNAGSIRVDGLDLARLDPERWRERISAAFQDHARFEFAVRETVGIGSLDAVGDEDAVMAALRRAAADDVVRPLPLGLGTQLGSAWGGIDLSGGQWQKLALGRAMMRTEPLLLLLDEPTAAIDADTEHRLFASWTDAAGELRELTGAITLLVSHRFSTVRMADLILVLRRGRLVEQGTHEELMGKGGLYAELYTLQAAAYR